jgi:hypothetical protein
VKTKAEIDRRITHLKAEIQYLETMDTGCRTCVHFHSGGCVLANGEEPPVEVIKSGCSSWEYDEIPF